MRNVAALMMLGCLVMCLSACASKPVEATQNPDGTQSVKVLVKQGYQPSKIEAKAGKPLKVEFYRDEGEGHSCDQDLVMPSENVNLHLPNRESQIVEIKAQPAGEVAFYCGMKMMQGKITFK
jgi:plastocyanin domain-containing protein